MRRLAVGGVSFVLLTAIAWSAAAAAQIPVRVATPSASTDSGVISRMESLRALSDGRVLVSDAGHDRVLLFDATLSRYTSIISKDSGSGQRYGTSAPRLIPYLGDSTVFVDERSQAFVVIDPRGVIARSMAPAKTNDLGIIGSTVTAYGMPAFDSRGRLVFRVRVRSAPRQALPSPRPDSGSVTISAALDSAPVLRMDFDARTTDTIAMMHIAAQRSVTFWLPSSVQRTTLVNPVPAGDEWALLANGTIAIVRSSDYHIDWTRLDGSTYSTPKMPFDWRPIPGEEKQQLLDSAKKAHEYLMTHLPPGETASPLPFMTVKAEDLPDYYPPLQPGQVKADAEGNVWILPSTSRLSTAATPGLVFDVVNQKGELFKRVRIPVGRNIVGFGPHTVYMEYASKVPGHQFVRLERAEIPN